MSKFLFPQGFLWGAATSSYQVEGDNFNNDWYLWEKNSKTLSPCAQAVDSYHRFKEDSCILEGLNQNSHRLSLEWSRIEPEKNKFSDKEISHYREVLLDLKQKQIKTILTLHHFTNPIWFYRDKCWENPEASDYFSRYAAKVVGELGDLVDYWITINEPLVYIYNSYIKGIWPPGEKSFKKALRVLENLTLAHLKGYRIIHEKNKNAKVSIAKHMRVFSPCQKLNFGQNNITAWARNNFFNFHLLNSLFKKNALDYLAINYYTLDFVKFSIFNLFGEDCRAAHHKLNKNTLGWYVYPQGLFDILLELKKFNLPIIISENGTAEIENHLLEYYLKEHIFQTARAIKEGVNVTGYLWWSLIDNFEWEKGFGAKFGLVSVDKNLNRKVKPFASVYKEIASKGEIEHG